MSTIYFSGTHGSGKTTLIQKLGEREGFIVAKKRELPPLKTIEERQEGRLRRAYMHAFDNQILQEANPDAHILCDRSSVDVLAYSTVFQRLGWVCEEYGQQFRALHRELFAQAPKEDVLVVVSPPIQVVEARIQHRWATTGHVKWSETDFKYLREVHWEYWEIFDRHKGTKLWLNQTKLADLESGVMDFLAKQKENGQSTTPDATSRPKEYHPEELLAP